MAANLVVPFALGLFLLSQGSSSISSPPATPSGNGGGGGGAPPPGGGGAVGAAADAQVKALNLRTTWLVAAVQSLAQAQVLTMQAAQQGVSHNWDAMKPYLQGAANSMGWPWDANNGLAMTHPDLVSMGAMFAQPPPPASVSGISPLDVQDLDDLEVPRPRRLLGPRR